MNFLINVLMWAASSFVIGGSFFGWCFLIVWWKAEKADRRNGDTYED